jgi:ABC-type Fe3+ transport system permease subunit
MNFDPKSLFKSPVLATAGGVVVGLGIFTFITSFMDLMIRPFFHVIFGDGILMLSRDRGIGLGCGAMVLAVVVLVVAVVVGLVVARLGTRE